MPFESYIAGDELFNNIDKEHDILDRDVRPFAEECDQLQGFQLFAGTDDAWGGFTARYVDRLRDEYGKNSIWVWGIENGQRGQRVGRATITLPGISNNFAKNGSNIKCSEWPTWHAQSTKYRPYVLLTFQFRILRCRYHLIYH
jgi:Tubulin domain